MLREYGSPILFLTLSCAEYDSLEISRYFRKLNKVPDSYPIGKLCTEDPISVSTKFSHKFHDFFQTVILKGEVLGPVAHYFYKKEYQARGAPHYHILLWIEGTPMAEGRTRRGSAVDSEQNNFPHSRRRQQSRAASAGHKVPAPQVQWILPAKEKGKRHLHYLL